MKMVILKLLFLINLNSTLNYTIFEKERETEEKVLLGKNGEGEDVYLGRVFLENDAVIPAMVISEKNVALFTYNGEAYQTDDFSYIVIKPKNQTMEWNPGKGGKVPRTAYIGGQSDNYTNLYVGNVTIRGLIYAGGIDPLKGGLSINYNGQEKFFKNYEVFCFKKMNPTKDP